MMETHLICLLRRVIELSRIIFFLSSHDITNTEVLILKLKITFILIDLVAPKTKVGPANKPASSVCLPNM